MSNVDPIYNLIIKINNEANAALDRAQENLNAASETLAQINDALGIKPDHIHGRQDSPTQDDDGFELPHLDPEDDPDTRSQMEKAADEGYVHPADNEEIPF